MVSRSDSPSPFPRSVGTARGQARRAELLDLVTDDLAANGLAVFSLRRAARAAGTTHKVLYHFTDAGMVGEQATLFDSVPTTATLTWTC